MCNVRLAAAVVAFMLSQPIGAFAEGSQNGPNPSIRNNTVETADTSTRLVVASWITPMSYRPGQSSADRVRDDIRAALEARIDAFALNVFSGGQASHALNLFITSADKIGATNFKVFLSADTSVSLKPRELVSAILRYADSPHYLKLDGRPVLTTYGNQDDAWWKNNILDPLARAGHPVTFIPYFHLPRPNIDSPSEAAWADRIHSAPSIQGLFPFIIPGSVPFYSGDPNAGRHQWSMLEAQENLAKQIRTAGKVLMSQYMPYYWAVCHSARQYVEYQGGRGMANSWASIIQKQRPQLVQIVTWNDYYESTFIQPTRLVDTKVPGIPSEPHLGYYELLKYYISWYKSGSAPKITNDGIFYFYRVQPLDVSAPGDAMACKLGPVPRTKQFGLIKDVAYVTTALTAPAELRVHTGGTTHSFPVPAGMATTDVPFSPGKQIFELWRNGKKLIQAQGADIDGYPMVENFNVYSGYAIAGGVSSDSWLPSDGWKKGLNATWFQ
jgi:glucan endo-1,3-alpha-glucosidase